MRPLLKYCGNKNEEDLKITSQSAASYLGFVFVPGVKREVRPSDVKQWLSKHPNSKNKKLVALFVNATIDEIQHVISQLPIDVIQCHGTESPETVANIRAKTGVRVWKAIHHQLNGRTEMTRYAGIADGYVIDAKVSGQWGGTGQTFDWKAVPEYISEGKRQRVPVFIAGGVDTSNVKQLLAYQPDGIDLSSGLEVNGEKSTEIITQFEGVVCK
ncbi:phosphoribosylanthranilate isomerase [Alkalicoccobacillus porphyridii]|nr:phosphoribosylanthranilate isomerase [Alkalicoccobacillus porphyridii]